jgi:hypothetical protein
MPTWEQHFGSSVPFVYPLITVLALRRRSASDIVDPRRSDRNRSGEQGLLDLRIHHYLLSG